MLCAVPGTEDALSASAPAVKEERIKSSERKRACVQTRERKLQRESKGRFKPGQRCTECCYRSWSTIVLWLALFL